jgi:hypothetical protein
MTLGRLLAGDGYPDMMSGHELACHFSRTSHHATE